MNIVIFGAPNSGKGTQCKALEQGSGKYCQISTGQLLRDAEHDDKIAIGAGIDPADLKIVMNDVKKGKLAPDEMVNKLVVNKLNDNPDKAILFDGFPRTREQAEWLDEQLSERGGVNLIIELKVDREELLRRSAIRRQQAISDGGTPREDDEPVTAEKRQDMYADYSQKVLGYYKENHVPISEILGVGEPKDIAKLIDRVISEASREMLKKKHYSVSMNGSEQGQHEVIKAR